MGMYKKLDSIITEYIGYIEEEFPEYVCANLPLYNSIVDECSKHLSGELKLENMSKDAQVCILEWEEAMKTYCLERS